MVDPSGMNVNIFFATVRRVASSWKMVLSLKHDNNHAETSLANKFTTEYVTAQVFC